MRILVVLAVIVAAVAWAGLATAEDAHTPEPPLALPGTLPEHSTAVPGGGRLSARIVEATQLRTKPWGRVVARLGRRTEFGGPQIVPVVGRRPGWVRVIHPELGNGRRGWIPRLAVKVYNEPTSILVDLSKRRAFVRRRGRLVRTFEVGIGRPGHRTPTGRFAVTDRILTAPGSVYGCCILALSGRQPNLPAGWPGGDRLAFHGTPDESTVGAAASTGCLRVRERDLRHLLRKVRVGTVVTIRR
jgi:lipoprotein-anchoring transpeptidase ErfK/SrfK